ncbi:hypothetical protein KY092_11265 [Natronomonas gomsonensis]|uniref:DUF7289 family protein n=1 Tax=Natronomonas gomsonensis TaxID=1046043 RepID=UPI0020CA3374|nr:hypothetical protein [Natronomonas gomsonensis]MCY4731133.1 hypothetical protein [Natronomonas gomsonensis]
MGIITGDRGQSEVVGAILLFGIFILALGLLQTYFVPQEIAATEQNHVEEVSDDFTEMYASIGDAAGSNRERSASLSLGTRYGVSTVFLTPPPARGTVESESVGSLSSENGDAFSDLDDRELVNEVCGLSGVETKALTYEPRYNEYQNAASHTYEAGVHYRIVDGAGLKNSQRLVDDESGVTTIHLTPITHGSIRESGTSREPITFKPGVTGDTGTFSVGEDDTPATIEIPIQNQDGWKASFDGDFVMPSEDEAVLSLDSESGSEQYRIRCTPIGINTDPENEPAAVFTGDDSGEDEDTGGINPIGADALVLKGPSSSADKLVLKNKADTAKVVTGVRVPWASNPGNGNGISSVDLTFAKTSETASSVNVGGTKFREVNEWTWSGEETHNINIKGISGKPNAAIAVVLEFEDGTTSTYFSSGKGNNS